MFVKYLPLKMRGIKGIVNDVFQGEKIRLATEMLDVLNIHLN